MRAARLLALLFVVARPQQGSAQEDPIHWKLGDVPAVVAGRWSQLPVRATLEGTWHLYGPTQPRPPIALEIRMAPEELVTTRAVRQPKPIKKFDEAFGIETEYFEKDVTFIVPFAVAATTESGVHEFAVRVKYQVCTDRVCLPPTTQVLPVRINVLAAEKAPAPKAEDTAAAGMAARQGRGAQQDADDGSTTAVPGAPTDESAALASSQDATAGSSAGAVRASIELAQSESGTIWRFLLLAMLMGAFALTTPCVFPMIPITVSYFAKMRPEEEAGGRPNAQNVRAALLYGGGIIAAFTSIGLMLALIYGATGLNRFAANPWINLLVAALFIAFALDLLGIWQMRLPWKLVARVNKSSQRAGGLGILLMGIAFAVTTFTCTVPFVGTLLVAAAAGDWVRPLLGMVAFSTVFALPFVVLALFPALLRSLPKSGSWMGTLMAVLGLIELGAALKFLSNADLVWQLGLLPRPIVLSAWIALALLAAAYLFGFVRLSSARESQMGPGRMLAGAAFIAVALFMTPGLFNRTIGEFEAFLPPRDYPGDQSSSGDHAWLTSLAAAQTEAAASGRNIFVDFTGYTCTNCRWMEAHVFPRPDIKQRLDQFVLLRLYTDGQGAEYTLNQQLQRARFGTVALPFYAIVTAEGLTTATFPGLTRKPEEFAAFLDKGIPDAESRPAAGI